MRRERRKIGERGKSRGIEVRREKGYGIGERREEENRGKERERREEIG